MNHARSHRGHMWLIATAAVGVLLLGSGIGVALAVAVLACGVMLGAIFWFLRQSARQPYAPDTRHEGVRRH